MQEVDARDIFAPPIKISFSFYLKKPVIASCPVPLAVVKCAEVDLGLALPRDVRMIFRR
jgi:hypothetical protein